MKTKSVVLVASPFVALVLIACSSGGNVSGPGAQDDASTSKASKGKTVVLEVTGPKSADINYDLGSDSSQDNGAKLPWKKTLTDTDALGLASVSGQNTTESSGKITCKITVDGKVVKTNSSTGQYAVVDCTATGY